MELAIILIATVAIVGVGLVCFNLGFVAGYTTRQSVPPVQAPLQQDATGVADASLVGRDRTKGAPARKNAARAAPDRYELTSEGELAPLPRATAAGPDAPCGLCSRVRAFFSSLPRGSARRVRGGPRGL